MIPDDVDVIVAECWGSGEAGEGTTASGGGGAYSMAVLPGIPGVYNFFIGNEIDPEISEHHGDTWFGGTESLVTPKSSDDSPVMARGATGAVGGQASLGRGDTKFSGGNGISGGKGAKGGGSSAGINSNGTDAIDEFGAIAPTGGGNGGDGSEDPGVSGNNGIFPGGGGGSGGGTGGIGGHGARGRIRLTYLVCAELNSSSSSTSSIVLNSVQLFPRKASVTKLSPTSTGDQRLGIGNATSTRRSR